MFANDIVPALLAARRQVAEGSLVEGQTRVAGDSCTLENREGEAWQPAHMDLVGSQTRGGANEIIAGKFDVRELFIPVVLELVDDHCHHLGHRVVYPFHLTVAVWVVGACGHFLNH